MLTKATWPLFTLARRKAQINTNPDYQRPSVWTKSQKQLLIDTILRDYDIPKIYLHKRDNDRFDVIDGQQRIRTIWSFYNDEFALAKDADNVNDYVIANKKYSELPIEISSIIDSYTLDFVILDNPNEDEINPDDFLVDNDKIILEDELHGAIIGTLWNLLRNPEEMDPEIFDNAVENIFNSIQTPPPNGVIRRSELNNIVQNYINENLL